MRSIWRRACMRRRAERLYKGRRLLLLRYGSGFGAECIRNAGGGVPARAGGREAASFDGLLSSLYAKRKKQIRTIEGWFADRAWKAEFDAIVARLPDFDAYRQCFIHTDIGPYNAMRDDAGRIVFY